MLVAGALFAVLLGVASLAHELRRLRAADRLVALGGDRPALLPPAPRAAHR